MAEKIISVKEGKIVEKGGKDWAELIDQDDKMHRVFRSIQNSEGEWIHLDKEIDMLKAKIEDGTINGLGLKLTKEKKGQFWNVVAVETVENVFVQEALKQVKDNTDMRCSLIQASNIVIAIIQYGKCPFAIDTMKPKQAQGLINVTKTIAIGLNSVFTDTAKVVEKIGEEINN